MHSRVMRTQRGETVPVILAIFLNIKQLIFCQNKISMYHPAQLHFPLKRKAMSVYCRASGRPV